MDVALSPGSSPLTRGKRIDLLPPVHSPRLIPAHAGKTLRARIRVPVLPRLIPAHAGKTGVVGPSLGVGTAHPRSRGENMCCTK